MRVVLYGSSLYIEGLEESLKAVPGVELLRLRGSADALLQQARRLRPDAVVIEAGALPDPFSLGLVKELPGLQLVTLDRESSNLLVLSGREARAGTTTDLLRVLESRRDSTSPMPVWQAHLDQLGRFISHSVDGLRARPRPQKLAFAFAAAAVCALLALGLSMVSPPSNLPLTGTAVGQLAPEVGLAFAGGVLVGALLLGLAVARGRHPFRGNIREEKQ